MALNMTPIHKNLHTRVTFLGLEFEDLIAVMALAISMNLGVALRRGPRQDDGHSSESLHGNRSFLSWPSRS